MYETVKAELIFLAIIFNYSIFLQKVSPVTVKIMIDNDEGTVSKLALSKPNRLTKLYFSSYINNS